MKEEMRELRKNQERWNKAAATPSVRPPTRKPAAPDSLAALRAERKKQIVIPPPLTDEQRIAALKKLLNVEGYVFTQSQICFLGRAADRLRELQKKASAER